MVYANLPRPEDRDNAIKWIREGRRVHSGVNLIMNTAPEFDPIRADPRFVELLRQGNRT